MLRRNQVAGIRTASTMASDAAWLAAYVRARRPTLGARVVAVVSGVLALLPVSPAVLCPGCSSRPG